MSKPSDTHPGRLPNLRHLRIFELIAGQRSLRIAADIAGVSQPAASQAIASLERDYGVALFTRAPSGLSLTEHGEALGQRVAAAFRHLRRGIGPLLASAGEGSDEARLRRAMAMITTAQLRALAALAQEGGFTAAARALGLQRPSTHRAVSDLEMALGTSLTLRRGSTTSINAAGEHLAAFANLALKELELAWHDLAARQGVIGGSVKVGTISVMLAHIIPTAFAAIGERYPEARFQVREGSFPTLAPALRSGRLDLLFCASRASLPPDLVSEVLFEGHYRIIARAQHPLVGKSRITAHDLAPYLWVTPTSGSQGRRQLEKLFEKDGLPPPTELIETRSLDLIRGLILGTDCLTVLDSERIVHDERVGLIKVLPVELPGPERQISMLFRRDWQPSALQRLFMDTIRKVSRE